MSFYSTKQVIFNNLNVNTTPLDNTPDISQNFEVDLVQGQNITYARIFATVQPNSVNPLGVAARLYFNGNLLQIFNFDTLDTTKQSFQLEITNEFLPNAKNTIEFKLDGSLQFADFILYADIYYSLNNDSPPSSQGLKGNPTTSLLSTVQQVEKLALVGGGALVGLYILYKIFK